MKPKYKMKTVVKNMERCVSYGKCDECLYKNDPHCRTALIFDAMYYMKQTLERSSRASRTHENN